MADDNAKNRLLEMAADLTVAWLSNPDTRVPAEELPGIIQKIHGALAGLSSAGGHGINATSEFTPAVSVRKSLASKEHIISLVDGKPYKMLKRHLANHGLTPEQYRERYGLKSDYPMVAENYAEKRRVLAKKIGLGRKSTRPAAPSTAKSPPAPVRAAKKSQPKAVNKAPAKSAAAPKAASLATPKAKSQTAAKAAPKSSPNPTSRPAPKAKQKSEKPKAAPALAPKAGRKAAKPPKI